MKKEIKVYPVNLVGEKSEVVLSSKGAKHYHSSSMFSFLPKGEVKRVVKVDGDRIKGYINSNEDEHEKFDHTFFLGHFPKGFVRVGCLNFSRSQWGRVKEWLFASASPSTPSTKAKVKWKREMNDPVAEMKARAQSLAREQRVQIARGCKNLALDC